MSQEPPSLPSGSLVEARGARWRVVESVAHEDCATCRLVGATGSNLGIRRDLLLPFDRPRRIVRLERWHRVGRRRWVLALRAMLASDITATGLRGAADARIDLLEYQLEPALASANGVMRLLLADEVGLGKTVQAALIVADVCARNDSARVLVLCPAGLCSQWERELSDRFGLRPAVVDLPALRRLFRTSSSESIPWDRLPLAIASVDFAKRPEVLQGMAGVRWDVLVVDEAHLSAVAAERAAAVNWLARRSRRVVLMTATPHPGEPAAFEALCGVGRLAGEGPVVMFRRTRSGIGLPVARTVRVLAVRLSAAERELQARLRRYTARVWKAASAGARNTDARLAVIVLAKRAASGPVPLLASLERRLRWLDRAGESEASQMLLPLGEPDLDEADAEPADVLAAPGLASRAEEIRVLENLVRLARAAVPFDSKARALARLVRRAREPAIVFTEYRDALAPAAAHLAAGIETAVVHGGLDRRARTAAVWSFTEGRAAVLLATDVAAHGLNLQARCRLVVNLDLPWNPVRLEQRIGRVDRIGQRRRVHAIHLVGRGTIEGAVMDRLTVRAARARESLGDATDAVGGEATIGDSVLGRTVGGRGNRRQSMPRRGEPSVTASAREEPRASVAPEAAGTFVRADYSREAREEAKRLTRLRQLRVRAPALQVIAAQIDRAGPWWTSLRFRGARTIGLLALFRGEVVDGRGVLLEHVLIPLDAWLRVVPGSPRAISLEALARIALVEAERRTMTVAAALHARLSGESEREAALAGVVETLPVVAIQAGLFDNRAVRSAIAAHAQRERVLDEVSTRLEDLRRAGRIQLAGPPRLELIALVRGG